MKPLLLLADIGNTHTHLGLANDRRVLRAQDVPTRALGEPLARQTLQQLIGKHPVAGVCVCSVVPAATPRLRALAAAAGLQQVLELNHQTLRGVGIRYPRPQTIGADRLANALAAKILVGAPVVVVDFGTAVTFDVVDRQGDYIGGIIAPGLAAMTDYLHEKTALLPRITIRDVRRVVGKNTEEAMRIGAVHGYRGLVRELIGELKNELACRRLPVVATGGYAALIARGLPAIQCVIPHLTLEGLRLAWLAHHPSMAGRP
ncbi:MAG: type III pantothenate kinase [Verrucomicrobiae bacterium]|nr:type III pantothenate kinase [Verrucomicrobiae bacterium]